MQCKIFCMQSKIKAAPCRALDGKENAHRPACPPRQARAKIGKARARCDKPGEPSLGKPCFSSAVISPKVRAKSFGQKNRIVTEAEAAARRENKFAKNLAFKALHVPAGEGDGKGASEMRLERRVCPRRAQRVFNFFHRRAEIPRRPRPTRGIDAGSTTEGFDAKPRIVGQRRDLGAIGWRPAP